MCVLTFLIGGKIPSFPDKHRRISEEKINKDILTTFATKKLFENVEKCRIQVLAFISVKMQT